MPKDLQEHLTRGPTKALGSPPAIASCVAAGPGSLPDAANLLAWDANSVPGFAFGTTNATAIRAVGEVLETVRLVKGAGRVVARITIGRSHEPGGPPLCGSE